MTVDLDPWERLARQREKHKIRSPIVTPVGGWSGPEPTLPSERPARRRRTSARTSTSTAPRRPRRRMTDQLREQMQELAERGLSAAEIAREIDAPSDQVRIWAKSQGITLVDGRHPGSTGRRPSWDVELGIRLAHEGMTVPRIAKRVGASSETVRKVLHRRGVTPKHEYH